MPKMSLEEVQALVHDMVMASGETPYAITPNQRVSVILLLQDYSQAKNARVIFAIPNGDDWFRHKVLRLLFGVSSANQLTLSQASVLIGLLKEETSWHLSARGYQVLDCILGELKKTNPVQVALL
jgi:hypothetical protein